MFHSYYRPATVAMLAALGSCLLCAGCGHSDEAAPAAVAPVVKTSVAGGTLVVPANLPPAQQKQIRQQEQATLDNNRRHVPPAMMQKGK